MIQDVDLEQRSVQFLYQDDGMYTFMDLENYNQYTLGAAEDMEEIAQWITDVLEGIMAMLLNGNIIGITPPDTVTMEITYTEPGLKGASATARTKPVALANNVEV
jgi:elongation factor P